VVIVINCYKEESNLVKDTWCFLYSQNDGVLHDETGPSSGLQSPRYFYHFKLTEFGVP
jgi:hypothetical protein